MKFILKTIYQQTEFVSDFIYMTPADLHQILNTLRGNILPGPINKLICDYAAPKIEDVRTLSCFKRDTQFYINLLYIGKECYVEAQETPKETNPINLFFTHNAQKAYQDDLRYVPEILERQKAANRKRV